MNIYQSIPYDIKQALIGAALLVMAAVSILATLSHTSPYQSLGNYYVSTNPAGIGIYQTGKHSNYLLTAYSDYFLNESNIPSPIAKEAQVSGLSWLMPLSHKIDTMAHYFGRNQLIHRTPTTLYKATIDNNTLTIQRKVFIEPNTMKPTSIVTVFPFNRDDIVFDSNGILYTENSDSDIYTLGNVYGVTITRSDINDRLPTSSATSIFIINPHVPGALTVQASEQGSIAIGKDSKQLQIKEPALSDASGWISTSLVIQTFIRPKFVKTI